MKRCLLICLSALCLPLWAAAYETTLLPQSIYVGDRARLIVTLSDGSALGQGVSRVVEDVAERLPRTADLVVTRMELESRGNAAAVVIDFIPFTPGTVEFPPMSIGSVSLRDLTVVVSSVLVPGGNQEPSAAEGPLSAPGTMPLLYALAFALLGVAALGLLSVKRFAPMVRRALARRRNGLAVRSMRRVLSKLSSDIGSMDDAEVLTVLFAELRSYLTYRTAVNCNALTASEFVRVFGSEDEPSEREPAECGAPLSLSPEDVLFLERLFSRGDEIRFGGQSAALPEVRSAVEDVAALIERIERGAVPC